MCVCVLSELPLPQSDTQGKACAVNWKFSAPERKFMCPGDGPRPVRACVVPGTPYRHGGPDFGDTNTLDESRYDGVSTLIVVKR